MAQFTFKRKRKRKMGEVDEAATLIIRQKGEFKENVNKLPGVGFIKLLVHFLTFTKL